MEREIIIPQCIEKRVKEFNRDSTRLALLDKIKQLTIIHPMAITIPVSLEDFTKYGTKIELIEPINPVLTELKRILKEYEEKHYSDIINLD